MIYSVETITMTDNCCSPCESSPSVTLAKRVVAVVTSNLKLVHIKVSQGGRVLLSLDMELKT